MCTLWMHVIIPQTVKYFKGKRRWACFRVKIMKNSTYTPQLINEAILTRIEIWLWGLRTQFATHVTSVSIAARERAWIKNAVQRSYSS